MGSAEEMARLSATLVLFFFLYGMEALSIVSRIIYGEWDGKGGDKISQALNLLMMAVSLGLFSLGFRGLRLMLPGFGLALGVLGFIALSVVWSIDPGETLKSTLQYGVVVFGAAGIAGAFEAEDILTLLLTACGISAFASLAAYFVTPQMARMAVTGELRGVFPHKNVIGPVMAIGALAAFHQLSGKRGHRGLYAVLLALFVICAALSRSATSLLTIFAYGGATSLAVLLRNPKFRQLGVVLTALAIPVLLVAAVTKDSLLEILGKDPTLTGRTALWALVEDNIRLRPLLGWGYSAFWQPNNPAAEAISLSLGWYVPQAHNGLLEILIELGFAGAALFISLWFRNLLVSIGCRHTTARAFATTALLFYASLLLMGASEAILLEPFELSTILLFLFGFVCDLERKRAREQRRSMRGIVLRPRSSAALVPRQL